MLGRMMQIVCDEIERLKTIHFLVQSAGDTMTKSISKVGNDIGDKVITPRLRAGQRITERWSLSGERVAATGRLLRGDESNQQGQRTGYVLTPTPCPGSAP